MDNKTYNKISEAVIADFHADIKSLSDHLNEVKEAIEKLPKQNELLSDTLEKIEKYKQEIITDLSTRNKADLVKLIDQELQNKLNLVILENKKIKKLIYLLGIILLINLSASIAIIVLI